MANKYQKLRAIIESKLASLREEAGEVLYKKYSDLFAEELSDEIGTYADKTEGNYNLLAKAFEDIGDKLRAFGSWEVEDQNKKCKYFTDALLHYLYARQILTNFKCESKDFNLALIDSKIKDLYSDFHKSMGSGDILESENLLDRLSHKAHIEKLRISAKTQIKAIKEISRDAEYKANYALKSNELFEEIASGMRKYLADIARDAEKFCGPAPCKYSVIGLGSMALKQITPYSDLEFAIIVEEDNKEVQEYFAKFSHYINFAVTALGESPIAYSTYNHNLDHLVKVAVNLDLGGKTSLGREDKDYSLVCGIDGMVRNLTGEHNESISEPKMADEKLPLILGNVCHVSGDRALTTQYQQKANEFLGSKFNQGDLTHSQARAVEILSFDGISRKANLDEFSFDSRKEGHLYDVKQEIYRIPDRMIYNLGQLYNIQQTDNGLSPLEVITKLEAGGHISHKAAENLRFASSFANILRLRTYDFYGQQKDSIDALPSEHEIQSGNFRFEKKEVEFADEEKDRRDGDLIEYYYCIFPLIDSLKNLCSKLFEDTHMPDSFFKGSDFYSDTDNIKSDIATRLLQYENVVKYSEKYLGSVENFKKEGILSYFESIEEIENSDSEDYMIQGYKSSYKKEYIIFNMIKEQLYSKSGNALCSLGRYKDALKMYQKVLTIREKILGINHPNTAVPYANMSKALCEIGEYDEALKMCMKALEVSKDDKGENSLFIASIYYFQGLIYMHLAEYENSSKAFSKALKIRKHILPENHPDIATCYCDIASVFFNKGNYIKAMEINKKALVMREKTLGENHPHTANSYINIGTVLSKQGYYDEAIEMFHKALIVKEKSLGENHHETATCYNNIATVLAEKRDYNAALKLFVKSLQIKQMQLGESHKSVAETYHNMGSILFKKGDYDEAIGAFEKSLEIIIKVMGENHIKNVIFYTKLGNVLCKKGKFDEAMKMLNKALTINVEKLGKDHLKSADIYNDIGAVLREIGDYDESMKMRKKALAIRVEKLGQDHPEVAAIYNNIGSLLNKKGEYDEAMKMHEKALAIREKKLGDFHHDLATSYNNIAVIYSHNGKFDDALKMYKKAIKIFKKTLGENDTDLASSYLSIGEVYSKKSFYYKALEMFEKALVIWEGKLGETHPNTIICYNSLSKTLEKLGRFKESGECKMKQLKAVESRFGKDSQYKLCSLELMTILSKLKEECNNASKIAKSAGKLEASNPKKAIREYEKALEIYKMQKQDSRIEEILKKLIKISTENSMEYRLSEFTEELALLKPEISLDDNPDSELAGKDANFSDI